MIVGAIRLQFNVQFSFTFFLPYFFFFTILFVVYSFFSLFSSPLSTYVHTQTYSYTGSTDPSHRSAYNTPTSCSEANGEWFEEYGYIDIASGDINNCMSLNTTFSESGRGYRTMWARAKYGEPMQCLILPPAPECIQAPWSRVNHLGNGRDGVPLNYTWTLPSFMNNEEKLTVVRIR